MKISLLILQLGLASFLLFSSRALQAQATATGHISAEVIDAITAVESSPMSFGQFAPGEQGGAIVIDPATGNGISTSTVVTSGEGVAPATFTVSGATDATFAVTLPQAPASLTNETGNGALLVADWTATSGDGRESFVLSGGNQTVRIGATLKVGSSEETPKGFYSGSYQVTFAYN